jgi:hypothetical protein
VGSFGVAQQVLNANLPLAVADWSLSGEATFRPGHHAGNVQPPASLEPLRVVS